MDIVGKRFGKLIVKNADDHRNGYVVCECDCGNITSVRATSLTKKYLPTRSCGCYQKAVAKEIGTKTIQKNAEHQVETNLRYRTNFQVIEDVNPPKNNTSGYKGVSWDASRKKWTAYISHKFGRNHYHALLSAPISTRPYFFRSSVFKKRVTKIFFAIMFRPSNRFSFGQ